MLLEEPGPTKGDLHFPLLGIPVRVHPMFWVVSIMLGLNKDTQLPELMIWVVAVFISIVWHEFGHALVIRSFGFRPWITLYGMGGLASYDPARHRRFSGVTSGEQILISLAGPGAGFLLAALLVGALFASGVGDTVYFISPFNLRPYVFGLDNERLALLLNKIFFLCAIWGLVNLLPIYPLDGGQIARELFLRFNLRDGIRQSLILSMLTAASFGIFAAVKWHDVFIFLFFGFIAFENFQALQSYSGRGRW
jgi:stage IV sporulation protein FB